MFEFEVIIQNLVFGVVLGGVYTLASLGMGLAWGLMHNVNFSHGEWIMIAMYSTFWLSILSGLDPLLLIPINLLIGAAIGAVLQKGVFQPVTNRGGGALMTILSTFGVSLFLTGAAQALWKQTIYTLPNQYVSNSIRLGPVSISVAHTLSFVFAIVASLAVYMFLRRTLIGKAILATSEVLGDPEAASLMGINTGRINILALALAGAATGLAGTLIATFYYITPLVGVTWSMVAFVVVVLGGLGSFSGLILSGIIVGVLETMGNMIIGQAYGYILVYAVFLLFLYLRPRGIKGRA